MISKNKKKENYKSFLIPILAVLAIAGISGIILAANDKVFVCHKPDGQEPHTVEVGAPAAEAHLREHEGDYLGECQRPVTGDRICQEVNSLLATFAGMTDELTIDFSLLLEDGKVLFTSAQPDTAIYYGLSPDYQTLVIYNLVWDVVNEWGCSGFERLAELFALAVRDASAGFCTTFDGIDGRIVIDSAGVASCIKDHLSPEI